MPNSKARIASNMHYEMAKAMLALAGVRQVLQTTHSATNGTSTAYTVQDAATRRVIVIHFGTADTDLRISVNTTAVATDLPLLRARYFIVDAEKSETINFYNTTGGAITVNVMEIQ